MFLEALAPYSKFARGAVAQIVGRACRRASLPVVGAHRLRHTAATTMLGNGASRDEIAQILRHRLHATTAIYGKVDHLRLRELAQPWVWGLPNSPITDSRLRLAELAEPWPGGAA